MWFLTSGEKEEQYLYPKKSLGELMITWITVNFLSQVKASSRPSPMAEHLSSLRSILFNLSQPQISVCLSILPYTRLQKISFCENSTSKLAHACNPTMAWEVENAESSKGNRGYGIRLNKAAGIKAPMNTKEKTKIDGGARSPGAWGPKAGG